MTPDSCCSLVCTDENHNEPAFCFVGNFLSLKQSWKSGDQVTMELPLSIRTEAIKGIDTVLNALMSLALFTLANYNQNCVSFIVAVMLCSVGKHKSVDQFLFICRKCKQLCFDKPITTETDFNLHCFFLFVINFR